MRQGPLALTPPCQQTRLSCTACSRLTFTTRGAGAAGSAATTALVDMSSAPCKLATLSCISVHSLCSSRRSARKRSPENGDNMANRLGQLGHTASPQQCAQAHPGPTCHNLPPPTLTWHSLIASCALATDRVRLTQDFVATNEQRKGRKTSIINCTRSDKFFFFINRQVLSNHTRHEIQ